MQNFGSDIRRTPNRAGLSCLPCPAPALISKPSALWLFFVKGASVSQVPSVGIANTGTQSATEFAIPTDSHMGPIQVLLY